jgi:hypothetical protein
MIQPNGFYKPSTLLFLLVCFCFISTSFAQSCLPETKVAYGYSCQVESDDNNESGELLNTSLYVKKIKQTCEFIALQPVENFPPQRLPWCNRDPPLITS